nr:hypothetical protein [Tanacetum cinerariifolium]
MDAAWFKEKEMLAEAHEAGQILDEEQLAFLTKDLNAYDSDCDDVSNAKAVLMANHSNYGTDVILEIKSLNVVVHTYLYLEQILVVFLVNIKSTE